MFQNIFFGTFFVKNIISPKLSDNYNFFPCFLEFEETTTETKSTVDSDGVETIETVITETTRIQVEIDRQIDRVID